MRPTSANLRRASHAAAALPALLGLAVLLGWAADIAWLRSGVPGYPPMMPNTALGLVLAGVAAWAGGDGDRWPRACGGLAAAIGMVTLFEFASGADTGANHLLFHDATASLVTPVEARPVPRTATCLALIGCALASGRHAGRRAGAVAEACALGTLLVALPVLIEYAFAAIPSPVPVAARGMSLPTALAACLLAASLLASHPSRPVASLALGGHEGSRRLRRLLPALLLAPIAVRAAWILLEPGGIGRYGSANLTALMAALLIATAAWDGHRLNLLDARHRSTLRRLLRARRALGARVAERTAALSETVSSLRASEGRTRSILENLADAVVIVDDAGIIREANPAAWRIFGCDEHRLSGWAVGTLVAGPDRPGLDACLALARPGDDGTAVGVVREVTGLRGDGTAFPMELSVGAFDFRGRRFFSAVIRDLGPRQAAEGEMRRRLEIQEQLAMVAASVPGAICSYRMRPDGAATMPFATAAVEDLYGFPPEALAADFSPVMRNVHPDDLGPLRRGLEDAFRDVAEWHGSFRYIHPAKGERRIEGRSLARVEPDGSVLWHGFVADVTDRHRVEEARRESERLARSVLDSLPDHVAVVDEAGEILAVNRAWRDFAGAIGATGVSEAANYLLACERAIGGDRSFARAFARGIRAVLDGDIGCYEAEYACHSPAARRWFLARVSPFPGPGPRRVVISHRDVTGLKLAEEAMREGEERFRTLADGISQFAWMADAEGGIHWFNRRWYDYTGAGRDDPLEEGWRPYVHPDHLERILSGVGRCIETGEPWEDTFPIRSRSGEYRWFLTRAMPVLDPLGAVIGWFGTNTDITERKELEARLTEVDRRKDAFLAMLGHELRNSLAAIRVAAEVLALEATPERTAWARDAILAQSRHVARLLDDLLDVSRIARGMIRLEVRPVDAAEVVGQVAESMRAGIEGRGHRLEVSCPVGVLPLQADPDRLGQVLTNLLGNAAKYTPPGGRIRIEAGRVGDEVAIRILDTGVGIAPEELPGLFEPFAQGARSLDRSEGGLGVGLAIAAEFARLHGGRIEASSAGPGQGSEFRVVLPAARSRQSAPPGPQARDPGGVGRILVVDDNRELARGLGQLLGSLGHEVRLAFDGQAGLDEASSSRPDLLLLDLGLPVLDGYEVARRLRADPATAGLPIIAISGYAQEEDRRRSADVGIDEHIAKPVDFRTLAALVARALSEGRGGDDPAGPVPRIIGVTATGGV